MLLEIGAPIIGVIAVLTVALLCMRHVTNKLYPDPEVASIEDAIELDVMRRASETHSDDKTLVGDISLARPEKMPGVLQDKGGFAVGKTRFWRADSAVDMKGEEEGPWGKGVQWGCTKGESPLRQSSSVYSRSMDGITLYAGKTIGSWESQ